MPLAGSSRTYGVAVIGCDGMGVRHVAAAAEHARARLVAVADWEKEVRERCREQYGAQDAYADYSGALGRVDVELVVATSPSSHAEIVAACLRAGKDVLCEKPLAPTLWLREAARWVWCTAKVTRSGRSGARCTVRG